MMALLTPLLGLLGGKITRWEIYGGIAAVAVIGWFVWIHEHDAALLARQAAKAQAVVAAQQLADAHAATTAVQAVADAAIKRADALARARMEVANAPAPAASCGAPAAVVRALGVLRANP